MRMITAVLAAALAGGCDSTTTMMISSGLAGTWESKPTSDVTITLVLTAAGAITSTQSAPVSGDKPTCRAEYVYTGTYAVTGSNIAITYASGRIKTVGCTAPDSDSPADSMQWQNFGSALSGAFTVSDTTLTLPAYGPFTRK